MIDLQVYASGLRQGDYVLRLGHAMEMYAGVRYKVDPDHDMIYFEFDTPSMSLPQIERLLKGIGLTCRFVGIIPDELREPGKKTERITL
ncbi:MAG: hypothetical protein ACC661_09950 [Verrucomicrobiales bacterium]